MITTYSSRDYRITYQGIALIENALERPDLVQVSVASGCTILVAPQKEYGIDYEPNGEYRYWYMEGMNTQLARAEAHYIYARLNRDDKNALLLFSVNDYDTDGKINGEGTASEDYYYIKIGSITKTDSLENPTLDREISLDFGYLTTPAGEDKNTWQELFEVTAGDLIRPLKKFTSYMVRGTLSIIGKIVLNEKKITDVIRQGDNDKFVESDDVIPTTKLLKGKYLDILKDIFHRKDIADENPFLQTFKQGIICGKDGFAEGLLGFGAKIDENGFGEMRGLKLWESLTVPQLNYNRVEIVIGDKWRSPGAGVIETVTPDTDAEGNELTTGTATLKLEEGEIGTIDVDDIAMGIWHFGDSRDATEDSDDGKGNFSFAGFTTAYWRITEVSGGNHKLFRYALRPGYTAHPQPQMTFSCRGNFTNADRQTSVYETRTYTRMLWKQNDWEIRASNIALQYGDLSNLNIFGLNTQGYSIYLNSVYFTGTVTQVKPDGTPVKTVNDRGAWVNNTRYDYYDRVSHDGCIWLCVNEDGTDTEPMNTNPSWLKQVDRGMNGQDGTNGKDGKQGIEGCVVRDSEWAVGTEYRNDSNVTDGSLPVRYIDVVLVRNDAVETGWDAYRCKITHVSSDSITYENTSYWEKFGVNVGAIFTSLIIAKNATINFLRGNQLLIQKADGTITAGLSGSDAGKKIRFWAGSEEPDNAPYCVDENGKLWATDAHITGEVNATSGSFSGAVYASSGTLGSMTIKDGSYEYGIFYNGNNTTLSMRPGMFMNIPYNVFTPEEDTPQSNVLLYLKRRRNNGYDRSIYIEGISEFYGRVGIGKANNTGMNQFLPALVAEGIGCYGQFCLDNKIIKSSTVLDNTYAIAFVAMSSSGSYIRLPSSNLTNGQILIIRKVDGSKFKIYGSIKNTKNELVEEVSITDASFNMFIYNKTYDYWVLNYMN